MTFGARAVTLVFILTVLLLWPSCGGGGLYLPPGGGGASSSATYCAWPIAGTVRDATTRAPIKTRSVIALESYYPDPRIEQIKTAEDGIFSFCSYNDPSYVVVALAADAQGRYYAPAVAILTTVPSANLDLLVGGVPTEAPGFLAGPVSTDSNAVALTIFPRIPLGYDVNSRNGNVILPLLIPSAGFVQTTTSTGGCSAAGCGAFQLTVPTQQPNVWSGTEWKRSTMPPLYTVEVDAPTCTPSKMFATPAPTNGAIYPIARTTLSMLPLAFYNCR